MEARVRCSPFKIQLMKTRLTIPASAFRQKEHAPPLSEAGGSARARRPFL